MINKTNVTDNIAIIIEHKKVIVETTLDYDISITFSNKEKEPTLDENGDLFEPVYESKVLVTPKNAMSYTYLSQVKENSKTYRKSRSSLNLSSAMKKTYSRLQATKEHLNEASFEYRAKTAKSSKGYTSRATRWGVRVTSHDEVAAQVH